MASSRKLAVLDGLFEGHDLTTARRLAGYGTRTTGYRWVFDDAGIAAIARERIRAGDVLPLDAAYALAIATGENRPQVVAPPATTLDEVRALLLSIRNDLRELHSLRELILLALPEETLVDRACRLRDGHTLAREDRENLADIIRALAERYNPVTFRALRAWSVEREFSRAAA